VKGADCAPEIVAVHAVDFAGREMGSIEQYFGLGDERRMIRVVDAVWGRR
jgi:hypothetical protein